MVKNTKAYLFKFIDISVHSLDFKGMEIERTDLCLDFVSYSGNHSSWHVCMSGVYVSPLNIRNSSERTEKIANLFWGKLQGQKKFSISVERRVEKKLEKIYSTGQ